MNDDKSSFFLKLLKTKCGIKSQCANKFQHAGDFLVLELKHFAHRKEAVAKAGREKDQV